MKIGIIETNEHDRDKLISIIEHKGHDYNVLDMSDIEGDKIDSCDMIIADYGLKEGIMQNDILGKCHIVYSTYESPSILRRNHEIEWGVIVQKPFDNNEINNIIEHVSNTRKYIDDFINNRISYKHMILLFNSYIGQYPNYLQIDLMNCDINKDICRMISRPVVVHNLHLMTKSQIKYIFFSNFTTIDNRDNKFIIDYKGLPDSLSKQFITIPFIENYLIDNSYIINEDMT